MIARIPSTLVWLCACIAGGSFLSGTEAPQCYLTGSATDIVREPRFGALLLGGGPEPDDAIRWLLEKADGGDVVVLRASGSDGYNEYFHTEIGGVHSVRSFVFNAREQSFAPEVADAIERAELVFLAGGDQAKYLRFWKGTPVQVLLNQHLRQGKPIGGTSAGLAVLGDTVYAAYGESIRSEEALRDPFSENLTMERGFLQVPYLADIITDSHFSERGRLGRLLSFQVAGAELRGGAPLIGLGVDESTALAIGADGRAQVFASQPGGRVYLSILGPQASVRRVAGEALSISELMIIGLSRDSKLQLPQIAIEQAAGLSRVAVVEGRVQPIEASGHDG